MSRSLLSSALRETEIERLMCHHDHASLIGQHNNMIAMKTYIPTARGTAVLRTENILERSEPIHPLPEVRGLLNGFAYSLTPRR